MAVTTDSEPRFTMELTENATSSLVHAVEHYQTYTEEEEQIHLKYVVLHTFQAIELFLKVRLEQHDPQMIYEKPGGQLPGSRTARFDTLVERLTSIGVDLTDHDGSLDSLRKTRNNIEHHQVCILIRELEGYLGRAMYFLDTFLHGELETDLRTVLWDELDHDAYRIILDDLFSQVEKLTVVEREIAKYVRIPGTNESYERLLCLSCGTMSILIPNPTTQQHDSAFCLFCDTAQTVRYWCELCGQPILDSAQAPDEFDLSYCEDCQDNYIFGRD